MENASLNRLLNMTINCWRVSGHVADTTFGTRSFASRVAIYATFALWTQYGGEWLQRDRKLIYFLTAISGLSARTYSCGGDGERLRGGGDGSLGGCSDSFGKNFRMPDLDLVVASSLLSSSSTSDGTGDSDDKDERSDESSSAFMLSLSAVTSVCRGVWRSEGCQTVVVVRCRDVH